MPESILIVTTVGILNETQYVFSDIGIEFINTI
jgi:hypothetical protein